MLIREKDALKRAVRRAVRETPALDAHTRLFEPRFGALMRYGVDELLCDEPLAREAMRAGGILPAQWEAMSPRARADFAYETRLSKRAPLSASAGCAAVSLALLGASPLSLAGPRKWLAQRTREEYAEEVFDTARVRRALMRNDPFCAPERDAWLRGGAHDAHFRATLTLDHLAYAFDDACALLERMGYAVRTPDRERTYAELSRFVLEWAHNMEADYIQLTLPAHALTGTAPEALLVRSVLPACRALSLPLLLVPPAPGYGGAACNMAEIDSLCREHASCKFLVAVADEPGARAAAQLWRSAPNVLPVLLAQAGAQALAILLAACGADFHAFATDSRVLDQLCAHGEGLRRNLEAALMARYEAPVRAGLELDTADIESDVELLLGGSFERFLAMKIGGERT